MSVVIETTLGDVTVDLFVQERPQTCMNFLKLCKIKYYNLCLFHSVNSNFLAQTGDPTGKGDGGESIFGVLKGKQHRLYQGEKLPRIKHDRTGLLSMVSHGDGMLGSQFVITLSGNLSSLDNEHCVFGQIVEGEELLLKLNEAITDEKHRPYQDIRITHTVILEDPFPDPENLEVPPDSPLPPNPKDVAYSRIPADEPLSENYKPEELDEIVQQREAAARAAILEMVGDIPDADAAPPENVLFVCKLNPVTSDHDLSIIFSRFGTVKSCEVIRDQVTGDSLQYAFIEFEDRKACEEAYFKMDNVLIDDRRIHVDFSQSVAKLKWRGKGKGVEILGPPPNEILGNKNREAKEDAKQKYEEHRRNAGDVNRKKNKYPDRHNNECDSIKNGKGVKGENEIRRDNRKNFNNDRKEIRKKNKIRRRKSSTSSSSSASSSESSSSSETSESSYHKKKKSSRKVLVVVKTPRRSKNHKKPRKTKNRKYKSQSESESDSEDQKKKKKRIRRKSSSSDEDSSSDEESDKRRKRKRRSSSSIDEHKVRRRKKRKNSETSESSSEEEKKKSKTRKRKMKDSSSDSERTRNKKWKKDKVKLKKKKQGKKWRKSHKYETESSSSSD